MNLISGVFVVLLSMFLLGGCGGGGSSTVLEPDDPGPTTGSDAFTAGEQFNTILNDGSGATQARTLTYDTPLTEADIPGRYSLDRGITFSTTPQWVFNAGGTGTVTFSEGDTNPIAWTVASGTLKATESDDSGDQWFWVFTPVTDSSGNNFLVTVTTPQGQVDGYYNILSKFTPSENGDGGNTPSGPITLNSGVPVQISGSAGSLNYYRITVPAGINYLEARTHGGSGDADIGVRYGALPTQYSGECHSAEDGNDEFCQVVEPASGDWYVMVYGYQAFSGVTLEVTVSDVSCSPTNMNPSCPQYSPPPLLIDGLHVVSSVSVPRGNSATVTLTVTRAEGFTGVVTLAIQDLPYGVFVAPYWDHYLESDQTSTTVTFVAQSDTPDGIYHAKVVARATGSRDLEAEFTILPERMERAPTSDDECAAHWLPLIRPVFGPTGWVDGWKAVSRLKDGVYGTIPDDRYQEWMIGFKTHNSSIWLDQVRERIIHLPEVSGWSSGGDRDRTTSSAYLMGADIMYQSGNCRLRSGFDSDLDGIFGPDTRVWTLISHRPPSTLSEQLVLRSLGTERAYSNNPVYQVTFERTVMPDL